MLMTNIKAAIVLIATENVAALRMFVRNLTKSIFKSTPKEQNAKDQDTQEPMVRKET
jgi:hypothetical protein